MSLIIKIGMMQMPGAGNSDELVSKLYSSFFPMRNDAWQQQDDLEAVGEFDASDAHSADFGPRIARLVERLYAADLQLLEAPKPEGSSLHEQ